MCLYIEHLHMQFMEYLFVLEEPLSKIKWHIFYGLQSISVHAVARNDALDAFIILTQVIYRPNFR